MRLTKICADTKVSILSGKRTRLEYTFFLAEILAQRNIEGTLRVSAHYLVQIRLILIDGLFHVISSLAFLVNEKTPLRNGFSAHLTQNAHRSCSPQ